VDSNVPFGCEPLFCRGQRTQLGIREEGKATLLFGAIRHYKGLVYLVDVIQSILHSTLRKPGHARAMQYR
jgi:hypothetical protein